MGIGLREWLAIIGVLIILAIVADGFRRYLGRSTLKFKLDRKLISQFSEETENSEILGPARVVQSREPVLGDSGEVAPNEPQVFPVAPSSFDNEPLAETEPPISARDEPVATAARDEPAEPADNSEISDIFIIYVESSSPDGFQGQDLLQSVLESGMRFGDMEIFHRHESMTGSGDKLFSMANALNPGVFDLDNLEDFSTRSLCFFMSLPGPKQPKQAFELMLSAARKLASELGGELKDDSRSDLTGQTIGHYRQRIVDFERRQMRIKY
ncbi:MAG: cell division protein ZipA [Gammaproteobacteria bacterium]|nr:cell division protein ZipA [Gammaproteobacteria bacterium]